MNQPHIAQPVELDRLVQLSDKYWNPWISELMKLASLHGVVTSDDADLWWDDFSDGKTPQESMAGFLSSDEGLPFRNASLQNIQAIATLNPKF